LHTLAVVAPNVAGLGMNEVVLPVVPMFHVNAWGLPYAVPMAGAKLVMPGPQLDGESLYKLFEEEGVTLAAGVPTIWLGLQNYLKAGQRRFSTLNKLIVGGTAPPESMVRYFEEEVGIDFIHAWGMTETSPIGTVCRLKPHLSAAEDPLVFKLNQGLPLWGVELKIVDAEGNHLAHDGQAMGDLYVRGHWVNGGYYHNDDANRDAFDAEGWFQTGDVATINPDGYLRIVDRSKDVIKSGGEWISSVEIENIAMGHPRVAEAAVVGMPHPRWDERPFLVLVAKEKGDVISKAEMDAYFEGKIAKWWVPDRVEMVEELPHTATGKLSKLQLRERFKGCELTDETLDSTTTL
jgi:fatty-acyl-CoA synthase